MSLNDVVSAERLHIGFFGLRNAGKSSVVNAVTETVRLFMTETTISSYIQTLFLPKQQPKR